MHAPAGRLQPVSPPAAFRRLAQTTQDGTYLEDFDFILYFFLYSGDRILLCFSARRLLVFLTLFIASLLFLIIVVPTQPFKSSLNSSGVSCLLIEINICLADLLPLGKNPMSPSTSSGLVFIWISPGCCVRWRLGPTVVLVVGLVQVVLLAYPS